MNHFFEVRVESKHLLIKYNLFVVAELAGLRPIKENWLHTQDGMYCSPAAGLAYKSAEVEASFVLAVPRGKDESQLRVPFL